MQKPEACLRCGCTSRVFGQGNILLGHVPDSAKLLLQHNGIKKNNLRVVLTTSAIFFPFSLSAYLAFASGAFGKR